MHEPGVSIKMRTESPFADCTDLIPDRSRLLEHSRRNEYLFFPGLFSRKAG